MVSFRSIQIELRSHIDGSAIPEYPYQRSHEASREAIPTSDPISVYIPTYTSSRFLICYTVLPPHPPATFFFFKLLIDGEHVVSWGVGEEEDYRGKISWALFEDLEDHESSQSHQRRAFFFPSVDEPSNVDALDTTRIIEIKVYRSRGRKNVPGVFSSCKSKDEGIALVPLNNEPVERRQQHQPKYYKFSLIDPLNSPFASFSYFYRTWDELQELGVLPQHVSPVKKRKSFISDTENNGGPQSRFVEHCSVYGKWTSETVAAASSSLDQQQSASGSIWAWRDSDSPSKEDQIGLALFPINEDDGEMEVGRLDALQEVTNEATKRKTPDLLDSFSPDPWRRSSPSNDSTPT